MVDVVGVDVVVDVVVGGGVVVFLSSCTASIVAPSALVVDEEDKEELEKEDEEEFPLSLDSVLLELELVFVVPDPPDPPEPPDPPDTPDPPDPLEELLPVDSSELPETERSLDSPLSSLVSILLPSLRLLLFLFWYRWSPVKVMYTCAYVCFTPPTIMAASIKAGGFSIILAVLLSGIFKH